MKGQSEADRLKAELCDALGLTKVNVEGYEGKYLPDHTYFDDAHLDDVVRVVTKRITGSPTSKNKSGGSTRKDRCTSCNNQTHFANSIGDLYCSCPCHKPERGIF